MTILLEARRSLKSQIKFLEKLLDRLNGTDKQLRNSSILATWCLAKYFNEQFMQDIKNEVGIISNEK